MGLNSVTRTITKEQYDEVISHNKNGWVMNIDEQMFFTDALLIGYGVYGARAYKRNEEYFLDYTVGSSCD